MPIIFKNFFIMLHKNNINKKENILEMNKEIGMLLPPKRANTSVVYRKSDTV